MQLAGRYQVLERVSELVGRGSFGVVVRAQDERTGAMVAVKVQRSTAHEAMLWSELRQLRRLRHPALPRVLEVGRLEAPFGELPARAPYLVTEWIGGSSLAALMRAPSRPSKEPLADLVIALLRDVGGALAVMHGAGLVHRDVAPANLHWDEQAGRAYLLDLGLAVAAMEAAEAAAPPLCGDVHGTLPYLPAEALTGRPEPRSDLYGLGASVIALVTGAPPFAPPQSTPEELALSRLLWAIVRDGQLPPLPQLPAPLAALVHRLTAREPSARPASAAALLDELEEVVAALPGHQPSPRQKAPAPPPPPLPLTGRAELVAALARHLDEPGLVFVVGGPASGGSSVVEAAAAEAGLQRLLQGHTAPRRASGTLEEVALHLEDTARRPERVPEGVADDEPNDEPDGLARHPAHAAASRTQPALATVITACRQTASEDAKVPWLLTLDVIGDERAVALARALWRPGLTAAVTVLLDEEAAASLGLGDHARGDDPGHGKEPAAADLRRAVMIGGATAAPDAPDAERASEPGWDVPARVARLAPLTAQQLARFYTELTGAAPSPSALADLLLQSGGQPVLAAALVAAAQRPVSGGAVPGDPDRQAASAAPSLQELWSRRLEQAPPAVQRLVCTIALWPGEVPVELALVAAGSADGADGTDLAGPQPAASTPQDDIGLAEVTAAAALGLVRRRGGPGIGPPLVTVDPVLATIALARLEPRDRVALARAALRAAEAMATDEATRAAPLLHLPIDELGAAELLTRAQRLAALGLPAQAQALADHLEAGLLASAQPAPGDAAAPDDADAPDAPVRRSLRLLRVELALTRGDYDFALRAARVSGEPAARLLAAKAHRRRGELDDAERELSAVLAGDPPAAIARSAAAALARVWQGRGRLEDAEELARRHAHAAAAPGSPQTEPGPELTEVLGLCAFYRGQLDEAERHFAAAERAAVADAQPVALGRALSLRGMVAQQRGQLALASDRYAHAAHLLSAAGEAHAAATADLNLGTALAERGRHGAALSHTMAAGRVFRSLGADADWVAAEVNRGNSLVALGETTIARQVIEAAQRDPAASPHLRAFARLILAEAARRDGDLGSARAWCAEVAEDAQQRGDAHALISAQVGLAESGAGLPHDELAALATSEDDRQRAALACARRTLLLGGSAAQLGAASASAEAVARRAQDDDRQERAFRGYAVAAALAQRAQDPAAAPLAQRALAAYGALVTAAPATSAPALERDPDRRALSELTAPAPSPAPPPPQPVGPAPHVARRLLALSLRISREIELPRVLDEVIDTAIELAHAERGFLLLRQADSLLAPVVARNFPASSSGGAADQISRSIAERAAQSGEPVLTIDAGQDARFDSASSVAALRLRSVLAVPLRVRGAAIGCIYVDHRLRRGAFDDDAAAVLTELADIAAIAIANAQLTAELRQRNAEIDRLNHALAAELAERDAELVRVRAAEGHGSAPPVRNRYDAIAGTSPPMLQMLALLDRAATTSFPVVVTGESGTGKELVARALHDHSTRRAGPFVAVNCGALPDTLLESELFGHVRGAFTGADRDRRGMFEVAHGGTLFLDEISDTSPAMQARLLRVLQDGVVRRLGDTATTKVDVRVVAASHTPLAQLVTAGRFREDLRFRLEVLSIAVPPLRDRLGDLPALVEHLLRQLGATLSPARPTPRLARAALRALGQHRWPGNVRELANVLAHGLAMAGDAEVIELEDLPAALAAPHKLPADVTGARRAAPGAAPVVELPPDGDLRLRPALRATERAYLRAAMERTGGNQTAAARLLGLSRFGLQKKLRRGEQDSDSDDDDAT